MSTQIVDRVTNFIMSNLSAGGESNGAADIASAAVGFNYHGSSLKRDGETMVHTFLPEESVAGLFTRSLLRIQTADGGGFDYSRSGGAGMVLVNVWAIDAAQVAERDDKREKASNKSKASKAKAAK